MTVQSKALLGLKLGVRATSKTEIEKAAFEYYVPKDAFNNHLRCYSVGLKMNEHNFF